MDPACRPRPPRVPTAWARRRERCRWACSAGSDAGSTPDVRPRKLYHAYTIWNGLHRRVRTTVVRTGAMVYLSGVLRYHDQGFLMEPRTRPEGVYRQDRRTHVRAFTIRRRTDHGSPSADRILRGRLQAA